MTYSINDITFIIPVKFDSKDRIRNTILCINWLHNIYNFKFIVKELDRISKFGLLQKKLNSKNIKYIYEENHEDFFHRTRILNDMLEMCDTELVCNLDCDVILDERNIVETIEKFNQGFDFVYPFAFGEYQRCIHRYNSPEESLHEDLETFIRKWKSNQIDQSNSTSQYGHAVFVKTAAYKSCFGENENFRSYAPEDKERFHRFQVFGYRASHLPAGFNVYHLEHHRGSDSNTNNRYFSDNNSLYENLIRLSGEDLLDTYKNYDYVKRRNFKYAKDSLKA
jgi:hypothetical protein